MINFVAYYTNNDIRSILDFSINFLRRVYNGSDVYYHFATDDEDFSFSSFEEFSMAIRQKSGIINYVFSQVDELYNVFISQGIFLVSVKDNLLKTKLFDAISTSDGLPFNYGYYYELEKLSESISYSMGISFIEIYDYDNSVKWYRECLNTDIKDQIRLIYEFNLINKNHLIRKVDGVSLREWIEDKNYELLEIGNGLFVWKLDSNEIDKVNQSLGELGLLIGWRDNNKPEKNKRKLV